jgi:hypothetical protein
MIRFQQRRIASYFGETNPSSQPPTVPNWPVALKPLVARP